MLESFQISVMLPTSSKELYLAWLDSKEHSESTGGKAVINPEIGGTFSAWDGYITGKNLVLEPYKKIIQTWRTTDFPSDSPDSTVEIQLKDTTDGLELTLIHTEIPQGQGDDYETAWHRYYFEPMKHYFE
jgi:activator of HSP90 ATPase